MRRALPERAADTRILAFSERTGTAAWFRVLPWRRSPDRSPTRPPDACVHQLTAFGVEGVEAG